MNKDRMMELVELIRRETVPVPPSGKDIIIPRKYYEALIKEIDEKNRVL